MPSINTFATAFVRLDSNSDLAFYNAAGTRIGLLRGSAATKTWSVVENILSTNRSTDFSTTNTTPTATGDQNSITLYQSGTVLNLLTGNISNNTAGDGVRVGVYFTQGAPPSQGSGVGSDTLVFAIDSYSASANLVVSQAAAYAYNTGLIPPLGPVTPALYTTIQALVGGTATIKQNYKHTCWEI